MSASADPLTAEIAELIDRKEFDQLEEVWTERMELSPLDLPFFFAVASAVKKKGAAAEAVSWLQFLADYAAERQDRDARVAVLLEIARMAPATPGIREAVEEGLRERFGKHPAFESLRAQFLPEHVEDLAEAARKVARWLAFEPGRIYAMAGRGAGRVVELNPALDVVRLEFDGARIPLSLVSAEKNLTPLEPDHFLRVKLEEPDRLRALAAENPAELVRRVLAGAGGTATFAELKDNLAGIVERWTPFWSAARKNPQLLVSGDGRGALVSWTGSAEAADGVLRNRFLAADAHEKIEIARREGRRHPGLAPFFAEELARESAAAAPSRPSLAWELSQAASKIAPQQEEAFSPARLAETPDLSSALAGIQDYAARIAALEAVRRERADWSELFESQFLREEDARVLAEIDRALAETPARHEEWIQRILRAPRSAPRAFLWLCQKIEQTGETPGPALLHTLIDALRREEFAPHRSRLKELFEPGRLAVAIARAMPSEEEGREAVAAIDRAVGLEDHRRRAVRETILMKFPALRAPVEEVLYSTPEAIEAQRKELERLQKVELPANAEAMRTAKEHGDLRENFEYHAARQKHEYLSARIAELSDGLARTRPLDPARIDASAVRVGTRLVLRGGDGTERRVAILGPWDSKPEQDVYSYQSEFARHLLGKKVGDRVALGTGEASVVAIEPWRKP
jgi:transcription elongation GreA/GreB family factor